jgi:Ca-activated chloride channel homolog
MDDRTQDLETGFSGINAARLAPVNQRRAPPRPRRLPPKTHWPALAVTAVFSVVVVFAFAIDSKRCHELIVWSSNEKSALLTSIAAAYEAPEVERRCVRVVVERVPSGDAEIALRRGDPINGKLPHVWSPAASTWALLLSQHRKELGLREIVPLATGRSLIKSPLVIAMPQKLHNTLKECRAEIGWAYILELARDPRLCVLYSAQWGRFRLAKTDPTVSTSGLHALVSTYNAAVGKPGALTAEEIGRDYVRTFVQGVEASVVHYGDSVGNFLDSLYAEDQRGAALKYVSAIAVEEKQVFDYNFAPRSPCPPCPLPPDEKLVAVYPVEGTLVADHPYVVLNADWVRSAHEKAALDFLEYLETEAIQKRFLKNGFRNVALQGDPDVLAAPYFDLNEHRRTVTLSPAAVLAEMQASWSDLRKRANILLVFDVAESMNREIADQRVTRLELVKRATSDALKRLNQKDAVGLWTFSTRTGEPYRELVTLEQLGSNDALTRALAGLQGGTGGRQLYATIRASVDRLRSNFATDRINAVVVLSNGDDDRPRSPEFLALLSYLRDQPEDERVRVFTIASDDSAEGVLGQIAVASKGRSYDARNPLDITRVLREVISNF